VKTNFISSPFDRPLSVWHTFPVNINGRRLFMSLEARLEGLLTKHTALDRKIADEQNRPFADDKAIAELKKRKLSLKDEILRLRSV
jgi:hypothetical protein